MTDPQLRAFVAANYPKLTVTTAAGGAFVRHGEAAIVDVPRHILEWGGFGEPELRSAINGGIARVSDNLRKQADELAGMVRA